MDKEHVIKERSKTRLSKEVKKRIETTMIGAIASVEKHFGHLWNHNSPDKTTEEKMMNEVFEALRSEILDKGNAQIRNSESEIANYDVSWNKYHLNIPIKK